MISNLEGARMSDDSILIIDDSPEWTDLLSAFFSSRYRVRVANCATRAIEMAIEDLPNVIIVDLLMPSVDGFGMIRRLKDTLAEEVPTVLFTGWNKAEIEACAASIGCAAVMSKCASLDELGDVVSSVVARRAA